MRPFLLACLLLGGCTPQILLVAPPGKAVETFTAENLACHEAAMATADPEAQYVTAYRDCMVAQGNTIMTAPPASTPYFGVRGHALRHRPVSHHHGGRHR